MLAALGLAARAFALGLRMRRARLRGTRRDPATRRSHLRVAKPAVVMLLAGFAVGPASALWLRGWDPFRSIHALIATLAMLLFAASGVLGRRLERGRGRPLEAHAVIGLAAMLAGAASFATGFALLP